MDLTERDFARFDATFPHILKQGSLLDVGCDRGHWLKYLAENTNLSLCGVDISIKRLNDAKRNLDGMGTPLNAGDIKQLQYRDCCFDQVTALEVLEHLPNWKEGLMELIRVASKRVVITVPYKEKLEHEICHNCGNDVYLWGHLNSFSKKDFTSFIGSQGIDCNLSFEKLLRPEYTLTDYLTKGVIFIIRRLGIPRSASHSVSNFSGEEKNISKVICQTCHKEIDYHVPPQTSAQIVLRAIARTPPYLLVRIDKMLIC